MARSHGSLAPQNERQVIRQLLATGHQELRQTALTKAPCTQASAALAIAVS